MWKVQKPVEDTSVKCSLCQADIIYIEPIPRTKIELLMTAYPNQEWLAYMVGKQSAQGYFVTDIVVPPHVLATSGSAEAEPFHQPKDCLGVIHSHNTMGAFHSGTDQAFVDRNFPISVTVAKKLTATSLEFDAVSFAVTPCGKTTTGKSQVKYVQPAPLFNTQEWLGQAKSNVDKGRSLICTSPFPVISKCKSKLEKPFSVDRERDNYIPYRYRIPGGETTGHFYDKEGQEIPDEEAEQVLSAFYKGGQAGYWKK